MSVETLDDRVGAVFEVDAAVKFLGATGPIAPSCRKANESYFGFVVLEGRGGGVRLPWLP